MRMGKTSTLRRARRVHGLRSTRWASGSITESGSTFQTGAAAGQGKSVPCSNIIAPNATPSLQRTSRRGIAFEHSTFAGPERRSCSEKALNLNVRQLQLAATRTIDERQVPDIDATSEMLQASGTPPDLPNRRSSVGAGRGRMVACRGDPAVTVGIVQREE
jgi:hypothetical protein